MVPNKYGLDLEIGGLWYNPFWQAAEFKYAMIAMGLLIVGLLIWWCRSKKRAVTPADLELVAFKRLQTLDVNVNTVSPQKYYFMLISNLKSWVNCRYNLNLAADTDAELEQALEAAQVDENLKKVWIEILRSSAAVRFAKASANRVSMKSDLEQILVIIKGLRQKE